MLARTGALMFYGKSSPSSSSAGSEHRRRGAAQGQPSGPSRTTSLHIVLNNYNIHVSFLNRMAYSSTSLLQSGFASKFSFMHAGTERFPVYIQYTCTQLVDFTACTLTFLFTATGVGLIIVYDDGVAMAAVTPAHLSDGDNDPTSTAACHAPRPR